MLKAKIEFDMPKSCADCPEVDCDMGYKYLCRLGAGHLGDISINHKYTKERHLSCPLTSEEIIVDYKNLLIKYIEHVGQCEGITYINKCNDPCGSSVIFSNEEIDVLIRCSEEYKL